MTDKKVVYTIEYGALKECVKALAGADKVRTISAIRVVGPSDVELNAEGGYSLGKRWVSLGESVAVVPNNEFIVFKADTGSRRYPEWRYYALRVVGEGKAEPVDDKDVRRIVESEPDPVRRARGKNSTAYAYALYIFSRARGEGEEEKPKEPTATDCGALSKRAFRLLADLVREWPDGVQSNAIEAARQFVRRLEENGLI